MKVAVKVGPEDWQKTFSITGAQYCEVWFRLDWQRKYIPLFKFLHKNKISFGLHFWAQVQGKYYPNLLYLKDNVAEQSFDLIKKTIEIAAKWQATYVNFHPESYRLNLLDLDKKEIKTLNPQQPINREKSFTQLLFYLQKIKKYGGKKGVISLIETVPKFVPADFKDIKTGRFKIQKSEGLETERFFKLVELGFPICFDIGHTIGQCLTENRKKLFAYLLKAAKKMRPMVNSIHITTTIPPFNGTDSHNCVLAEDFKAGAFPNRTQLIKLLSLFKEKDVWLIPEPHKGKMIANFFALKKIVAELP